MSYVTNLALWLQYFNKLTYLLTVSLSRSVILGSDLQFESRFLYGQSRSWSPTETADSTSLDSDQSGDGVEFQL